MAGGWQCPLILISRIAPEVSRPLPQVLTHPSQAHFQRAGEFITDDDLPESCWEGLFRSWWVAGLEGLGHWGTCLQKALWEEHYLQSA